MNENYDKRLGKVETEQARQGERLDRIERDLGKVGTGVEELLRREQPTNWRTAIFTGAALIGIVASLVGFSWWFTSVSPVVQEIERRVFRLDDPEIGRVPRLEKRADELERWAPRVTRN